MNSLALAEANPAAVFTIDVGFTTERPIIPEQYVSRVRVTAPDEPEAKMLAALMVMRPARVVEETNGPNRYNRTVTWWPAVQMPTSTTTVCVEW